MNRNEHKYSIQSYVYMRHIYAYMHITFFYLVLKTLRYFKEGNELYIK